MNLQPLFEKQQQLDQYIIKKKGLEGQDLLPNKILALQVELGELANEWRGFKHWSDNQEPKHGYEPLIDCDKCGGKGFWFSGERVHCQKCKQTGKVTNPLLEEYVDCLHFILSIGNDLGIAEEWDTNIEFDGPEFTDITSQFVVVFSGIVAAGYDMHDWFELTERFLALGELLGFAWEHIEQAYNEKWDENNRRQAAGY
ncbi:dUTP diphosphatase [Brevibacillus sp. AG]|uniref:dUTP diphosphatase n=1 Tax=Brevibacillus sp. AG TaxID=3020891 RepID=UPI00232FB132|nr:dUTP diphosphatase [Brevibacillus sp. AG]MDC0763437.1 dUTP diphosphatase [Brevibacillus sp. AG]